MNMFLNIINPVLSVIYKIIFLIGGLKLLDLVLFCLLPYIKGKKYE